MLLPCCPVGAIALDIARQVAIVIRPGCVFRQLDLVLCRIRALAGVCRLLHLGGQIEVQFDVIWQIAARPCRPRSLRVAAPLPRSVPDANRSVIYEFAMDTSRQEEVYPSVSASEMRSSAAADKMTIPPLSLRRS